MLNREGLNTLKTWYHKKLRKPLLIRGARQVGKTTLVKMFAELEDLKLIEINCEKPWSFTPLLEDLDTAKIIEAIEFELNISINPLKSLIFFDEVQNMPSVLKILRYFYEEAPEYKIITTGSLLEFVLDEPEFSVPVGRMELLYIGPFSFEEFLHATGEISALTLIQEYKPGEKISNSYHKKLSSILNTYISVGGMPEVVNAYVNGHSMIELERIKSSIIDTFKLDFHKYKKNSNPRLLSIIFDSLPIQIGKKIKYSNIDRTYKSNDISKSMHQLYLARIISKVYNTSCNGVPLSAERKENFFKSFLLDIGLIHTQLKLNPFETIKTAEINYINKGVLSEQLIAQQLVSQHQDFIEPQLYYWAREKKASSAEVDFVITDNKRRIIPIEVKSGSTGSMRSLQIMVTEKSLNLAIRINSDPPSIFYEKRKTPLGYAEYNLYSLPHYLSGQVIRIVDEIE
jgi:uncharacterized protein